MRLAAFIVSSSDAIVAAFEAFAATILPAARMDSLALRDHAVDLLLATVRDMESVKTEMQRADKASGYLDGSERTHRLNGASEEHAIGRLGSGFNLTQLVSEYRALRVSVLSLWHKSSPAPEELDVDELSLFNESIDQSLSKAVSMYTKRVDESRDMFLAILSHDLRSPLTSIAMNAQAMPRVSKLDGKSTAFAAQITDSARVMAKMISDLLDYTRTRLGAGMPIDRSPIDLRDVAQAVVDESRSANPGSSIVLDAGGDARGDWDADRLRQVISNLLGNAIQHGDRASPITITLRGEGGDVSLSINNAGAPIPPGEMSTIFDPLVRGAGSRVPRHNRPGSIGLGLYIARELVLAHDGRIDVTSTVDAGTTFTFRLPRRAHDSSDLRSDARTDDAPHGSNPGAALTPA